MPCRFDHVVRANELPAPRSRRFVLVACANALEALHWTIATIPDETRDSMNCNGARDGLGDLDRGYQERNMSIGRDDGVDFSTNSTKAWFAEPASESVEMTVNDKLRGVHRMPASDAFRTQTVS